MHFLHLPLSFSFQHTPGRYAFHMSLKQLLPRLSMTQMSPNPVADCIPILMATFFLKHFVLQTSRKLCLLGFPSAFLDTKNSFLTLEYMTHVRYDSLYGLVEKGTLNGLQLHLRMKPVLQIRSIYSIFMLHALYDLLCNGCLLNYVYISFYKYQFAFPMY